MVGITATLCGHVCGQRREKWRICLFSPKCPQWTFRRKVPNFSSRPDEAGVRRLVVQFTGATPMGNVSCWFGLQPGVTSGGKGCEEWRQVRGSETPSRGGWPVVPQKVTPNSSLVMCQYKREWQLNISNVPEERLKQAYQLVCATRRGRARVRQIMPSDQAVEK